MNLWLIELFGKACGNGNFLFFPTWYEYLGSQTETTGSYKTCSVVIHNINDVWLIVAAIVEILLRVAALIAVVFIIWSGSEYLTSEGNPDKTNRARSMLISALVGLTISILAASIVNFLAESIK